MQINSWWQDKGNKIRPTYSAFISIFQEIYSLIWIPETRRKQNTAWVSDLHCGELPSGLIDPIKCYFHWHWAIYVLIFKHLWQCNKCELLSVKLQDNTILHKSKIHHLSNKYTTLFFITKKVSARGRSQSVSEQELNDETGYRAEQIQMDYYNYLKILNQKLHYDVNELIPLLCHEPESRAKRNLF